MTLAGARILVVDDDPLAVDFLVEELGVLGAVVEGVTDGAEAVQRATDRTFDLIVSDIEMPGLRGVELLEQIRAQRPSQLVVLVTAFGSIDLAVECLKRGAVDFVTKPFRVDVLAHVAERALRERALRTEVVRLRRAIDDRGTAESLVARSAAMRQALDLAARAARGKAPVLLTGESGTGKSRLARFIHDHSERAAMPFVQINCAALPAALLEAELFGVRRGAFTGATDDRDGLFVEADGGTLFLDEIGELSLPLQPKLLHALESSAIRAIGGKGTRQVDVRIIAATNLDLELALRSQRFRPDLYFRLNVIRIAVPPLSARTEDIPALIDALLQRADPEGHSGRGHRVRGVSSDAMRHLLKRPWPGNVRELANVMERAIALAEHDVLVLDDVVDQQPSTSMPSVPTLEDAARRQLPLAAVESAYARLVLEQVDGNVSEAARILDVDRRTLSKKIHSES